MWVINIYRGRRWTERQTKTEKKTLRKLEVLGQELFDGKLGSKHYSF
jgi:hypothetical protein